MVIDFHVHAFNPKIAEKAIGNLEKMSGLVPFTRGSIEQTVERFDEWGVDKGVLLTVATKPSQQKIINDWSKEQDGGRFISFGGIHPDAEDALVELDRIKAMGLHGVKLHPDFQSFFADDEKLDDIYSKIESLGLPLVLHSGYDFSSPELYHCTPERALNVIKKHPHLKLVLAHLGGNACWDKVYDLLAGIDGEIYFDTGYTTNCPDEMMEKIIKKHGADRILFGSDCPWDSAFLIKEKIRRLNISASDKDKILGENAARLLNL